MKIDPNSIRNSQGDRVNPNQAPPKETKQDAPKQEPKSGGSKDDTKQNDSGGQKDQKDAASLAASGKQRPTASESDDDDSNSQYRPATRDKREDKMGGEDNDPFKGKGPKKGTREYEKARRELEEEKHREGRGGRDNERPKKNPFEDNQ